MSVDYKSTILLPHSDFAMRAKLPTRGDVHLRATAGEPAAFLGLFALELAADLLRGRLAAELLHEPARDADELVDRLHHVDGDADRARLVGDGAGDRLADPQVA